VDAHTEDYLLLPPDVLRIGQATAMKIIKGPRFSGKTLKIPGYYCVFNSQTEEKENVTPHLKLLANFLRYKMSKMISSESINLQVDV